MKERYVNASEIGTYVYCAKAWQLSQIGAPSEEEKAAEQREGSEWQTVYARSRYNIIALHQCKSHQVISATELAFSK